MEIEPKFFRLFKWELSLIPILFLEGIHLVSDQNFLWGGFIVRSIFVIQLLLILHWRRFYVGKGASWKYPWVDILVVMSGGVFILIYLLTKSTESAWLTLSWLYIVLLMVNRHLGRYANGLMRWGGRSILTLVGGLAPVAISQIEANFADEEFFVAMQAIVLMLFWALLSLTTHWQSGSGVTYPQPKQQVRSYWIIVIWGGIFGVAVVGTVHAYQRSFYANQVPSYAGISVKTPFLCGQVEPDQTIYQGEAVFRHLLERVEANPDKGPPEYGMLALGSGEAGWANAFHDSIINEAEAGKFTAPAHSLKSIQYEAALRAYYLSRVQAVFPDFFSESDLILLKGWFADINRRALTVEWIDWMYGLAFSMWPQGPYENQDIGLGLLALLEVENLAEPDLSPINQRYLDRNRRGWHARFRNVDDALIYQPAWINNAYFQSLYRNDIQEENLALSFAWVLLQALPDGSILEYNYPFAFPTGGNAYLGAHLLQDPNYLWIAGRTLEKLAAEGGYLLAQPGLEQKVSLVGRSPTVGSCLMYGDSGLPNQLGPLAPDKIVFRDGWTEDDAYLMLNLRFSGWHRYKATNAVTLVHQNGPLSAEISEASSFNWLPVGRSLLRDKRIPRENLNGLLIERSGMNAVLHQLTEIGSRWAQDPPQYAEVIAFETGDMLDRSQTRIVNWRGWQHDRWVYFYHHQGPIVIVDQANGPAKQHAALIWHITGQGNLNRERIPLRGGSRPAELLILAVNQDQGKWELMNRQETDSTSSAIYRSQVGGDLTAVTIFLFGQWVGAEAKFDATTRDLRIEREGASITLPLEVE